MKMDSTGCRIPPNGEYCIEKIERLERELRWAQEGQKCECGWDDMCRFAAERDKAISVLREVIQYLDPEVSLSKEINEYLEEIDEKFPQST